MQRLEAIERPKGLIMKIAYRISRIQFGKVITPMKLIYARRPALMSIATKTMRLEKKLSIGLQERLIIKATASLQNGCRFCHDLALAVAIKSGLGDEKFKGLSHKKNRDQFTQAELAIIIYVEEYARTREVSDETFNALKQNFSDKQIVDIIWMNAVEQYFNALAIPLQIESDNLAKERSQRLDRLG